MIVCHCQRVSARSIARAVQSGCSTAGEVSRATGAGRGCGGCITSVKRLIEEHFSAPTSRETPSEAA